MTTPTGLPAGGRGHHRRRRAGRRPSRTAAGLRATGRWHALVSPSRRRLRRSTRDDLAAGLDAAWLDPHRARLRETVLQAGLLAAAAYGELGDHAGRGRPGPAPRRGPPARRARASRPDPGTGECRRPRRGGPGVRGVPRRCSPTSWASTRRRTRWRRTCGSWRPPSRAGRHGCRGARRRSSGATPTSAGWPPLPRRPGLVTVSGPGGVGKSRLAQEVAARAVDVPGRTALGLAGARGTGRAGRRHRGDDPGSSRRPATSRPGASSATWPGSVGRCWCSTAARPCATARPPWPTPCSRARPTPRCGHEPGRPRAVRGACRAPRAAHPARRRDARGAGRERPGPADRRPHLRVRRRAGRRRRPRGVPRHLVPPLCRAAPRAGARRGPADRDVPGRCGRAPRRDDRGLRRRRPPGGRGESCPAPGRRGGGLPADVGAGGARSTWPRSARSRPATTWPESGSSVCCGSSATAAW